MPAGYLPTLSRESGHPVTAIFATSGEIRNTGVVKNAETYLDAVPMHDGKTRRAVARLLLEQGPVTAAGVAEELGISPTAVRRHIDALLADGEATTRDAPRQTQRGRGRPAKLFLLTDAGRARFGHAYDDLAVAAIRFLAETGGEEAVRAFAQSRVDALVDRHRSAIVAQATTRRTGQGPCDRADQGGLRCVDTSRRGGRAVVPAPLPGRPRRRRVPPAVRDRDGDVRGPARYSRAAPRDDRPRRRRVHDAHPDTDPRARDPR